MAGKWLHDFNRSTANNNVMVLNIAMVNTLRNPLYFFAFSWIPSLAHRLLNVIWN